MQLDLIQNFIDIVQASSFNQAAVRNNVSRSKVSKNLQALEKELGITLIQRNTRRFLITAAGQNFYQHALQIIEQVNDARMQMEQYKSTAQGDIRISVPTGLGDAKLSDDLLEFQRIYPDIKLRILFSNRVHSLLQSRVDVAVRVARNINENLIAREIGTIRHSLYAHCDFIGSHYERPDQIPSNLLLIPPQDDENYDLYAVQTSERILLRVTPRTSSENFPFLKKAMMKGAGVAVLPDYMMQNEMEIGSAKKICPAWHIQGLGEKLYILTAEDRSMSQSTRILIDYLKIKLQPITAY